MAGSWKFLRVGFHHIEFSYSVDLHSCFAASFCIAASEDMPMAMRKMVLKARGRFGGRRRL